VVRRAALLLLSVIVMQPQTRTPSSSSSVPTAVTALVAGFKGILGLAARNLSTGEEIAVNADTRFPTASTIKVAIMVEAYHQAAEGQLPLDVTLTLRDRDKVGGSGVLNSLHDGLTVTVADLVHLMIALSDNTATNLLVGRLGTARINARLATYGLTDTKLFRPTFRDGRADVLPELEQEFGLGMTTPRDMMKLMALIAEGKVVNTEASGAMLATLRRQQDRAMIPRLLPNVDELQVGNKTGIDAEKHRGADGSHRHVRGDIAIVTAPGLRYVVAILARDVEDTRWGVENDAVTTAARVSRIVYDHFAHRPH
jgi:beta-lactamase class A